MAQRRMFSKSITNSSQFLMMPQSSQNLYFHFGMNADDDGFCEHFSIMRMTESKPDDLKVLQAHNFVNVFDDRVLVITAWKENNYLRSDRYTPSKYLAIYKKELQLIQNFGIPKVDQRLPQVRLGKERIGKLRINKTKHADFVFLTADEYVKLLNQFGEQGTKDRIEKLSLYKGSNGRKYASDYLTILNWERKNNEKKKQQTERQRPVFDPSTI